MCLIVTTVPLLNRVLFCPESNHNFHWTVTGLADANAQGLVFKIQTVLFHMLSLVHTGDTHGIPMLATMSPDHHAVT